MANLLYPKWKENLMKGNVNARVDQTGVCGVYLVDTESPGQYTYDPSHEFLQDLTIGARIASGVLAGNISIDGLLDADDLLIPNVTGVTIEAIVISAGSGETTSPLVAYYDAGIGGFPLTPSGTDVTIAWNPAGIFQL